MTLENETALRLGGTGATHTYLISWGAMILLNGTESCVMNVLVNGSDQVVLSALSARASGTAAAGTTLWSAGTSAIVALPDNAALTLTRTSGTCALTGDFKVGWMTVALIK